MEAVVYQRMAAFEESHWWFRGRRAIVERLLRSLDLPPDARLLEVGCGTGGNLALLQHFGRVDAVEFDQEARQIAERKGGIPIGYCELPSHVEAEDAQYDLVALLDVLEHIGDDIDALRTVGRKMKPGGRLLLTVPAYPWLWSSHDEAHHHKRRYTRQSLSTAIEQSGLRVDRIGAFNTILFPLALAHRLSNRLLGIKSVDDDMPGPVMNRVLGNIFLLERHVIGRVPMPAGLSLFAVARQS